MSNIIMEKYSVSSIIALFSACISVTIRWNEVISMKSEEMKEIDLEEEKQYLLDLMKKQNEALKRIYKNTIENEKNNNPKGR